ncbi:hypothetical protein D3C75_224350 [compost metagenome]
MSTSYHIQLADYQRQILEVALKHLPFEAIAHIELPSYEEGPAEVIAGLKEMFEGLPEHEAKYPGTLYGFAL